MGMYGLWGIFKLRNALKCVVFGIRLFDYDEIDKCEIKGFNWKVRHEWRRVEGGKRRACLVGRNYSKRGVDIIGMRE